MKRKRGPVRLRWLLVLLIAALLVVLVVIVAAVPTVPMYQGCVPELSHDRVAMRREFYACTRTEAAKGG